LGVQLPGDRLRGGVIVGLQEHAIVLVPHRVVDLALAIVDEDDAGAGEVGDALQDLSPYLPGEELAETGLPGVDELQHLGLELDVLKDALGAAALQPLGETVGDLSGRRRARQESERGCGQQEQGDEPRPHPYGPVFRSLKTPCTCSTWPSSGSSAVMV